MKSLASKMIALSLAIALVSPLIGEDKPAKKAGKKKGGPIAAIEKQVATLDLSDEQKQKVSAILEEFKQKAAQEKNKDADLTKEQKKAQKEAQAQAKADGKKGKELKAEVEAAVKLTDEQKKAQQENAAQAKERQNELKKSLTAVLSPEQIEKLGLEGKKKKKNS